MCIRDRYQRRVRGSRISKMSNNQGYEAGTAVQSNAGDGPPEYTMVFGLQFEDPEVADLVRKVLRISIVGAVFVILSKVVRWETYRTVDEDWNDHQTTADLFLSISIGLMVPTCGYIGAKQKNRNLLNCFYGWSLACGICGGITAVLVLMALFTGVPVRNEDGSETGETKDYPVALGLVNILFGILQAVIYSIQYRWGKELAMQELFVEGIPQVPEPRYDLEVWIAVEAAVHHLLFHRCRFSNRLVWRCLTEGRWLTRFLLVGCTWILRWLNVHPLSSPHHRNTKISQPPRQTKMQRQQSKKRTLNQTMFQLRDDRTFNNVPSCPSLHDHCAVDSHHHQ
eukprot:TRINITY_DN3443_c0_g1_i5.p1 TRINITY_DN3443_c0_g1~~TRINITY_DN3443_c0_g1_i5.p1  ORF type:complete len:339 (+),score=39.16 TRINITY_DN3443_c0_g1_i5:140-1156(+)